MKKIIWEGCGKCMGKKKKVKDKINKIRRGLKKK